MGDKREELKKYLDDTCNRRRNCRDLVCSECSRDIVFDWHTAELSRVKGECERIVDGLRKKSNQIKSTEKTIVSTTDEKGEEIPAVIYLLDDKLFDAALDKIRAL